MVRPPAVAMLTWRSVFVSLTAVWVLAPIAQTDIDARKGVERFFRKWERAVARKDIEGLAVLLDPSGYTLMADGTKWPFKNLRADFKQMFAGMRNMRTHITIDGFGFDGREAVAWFVSESSFESKNHGRWEKGSSSAHGADTFRLFHGEWKCVSSQSFP